MPFKLSTRLPEGYWTHNSGNEHASKHRQDVDDINHLRLAAGDEPYDERELYELMKRDGVVTLRQDRGQNQAMPAVGYVVADRQHKGTVEIKGMYVVPGHRQKGLGGFLLGRLITSVPMDLPRVGMMRANYDHQLVVNGETYLLPGMYIVASEEVLGADGLAKLEAAKPDGWDGIVEIEHASGETLGTIFRRGLEVGTIIRHEDGTYGLSGSSNIYDHPIFSVIELLNPGE